MYLMAQWVINSFLSSYQNILCHFKTNVHRKLQYKGDIFCRMHNDVTLFLKKKNNIDFLKQGEEHTFQKQWLTVGYFPSPLELHTPIPTCCFVHMYTCTT